jgi:hypothetical protein
VWSGFGEDGEFVVPYAVEEAAEDGRQGERDGRGKDGGEDGPDDEGVALPQTELADQGERGRTGGVEEFPGCEGQGGGVEEAAAEAEEGDDQDELQRVGEVVGQLRGYDVEPEDKGQHEAEEGGGAEEGVDADEDAEGEAPGKLLRSSSTAKECQEGKEDPAIGPAVLRKC